MCAVCSIWTTTLHACTQIAELQKGKRPPPWEALCIGTMIMTLTVTLTIKWYNHHGNQIAELRKGDGEVPKMVARLYHRMALPHRAMEVLEKHMRDCPGVHANVATYAVCRMLGMSTGRRVWGGKGTGGA